MSQEYKYIGKTVPIHDIHEKVSGKMKYACDMTLPDMVHGSLILSTVAHGKVKSMDISKAEALEGVLKVFTPSDSPRVKYNSHKWYAGHTTVDDELIFTDHPMHVGDRIGAVIATSKRIADQAVQLIDVNYEVLDPVLDVLSLDKENQQVFEKHMSCGDYDQSEGMVFSDTFKTQRVHHAAMETHVSVANMEPGGILTIWAPCQVAFQVRLVVAQVLEMPLNKVRVIKSTMGGSFGGKGQPIIEPVAAFLAKSMNRPVKLVLNRQETIIGSRTRNPVVGTVKTVVSEEGLFKGRHIEMIVDAGAYYTNADAVAMAMGKKSSRMYYIPNQIYDVKSFITNGPVGGACRGYGSPQLHAVTEVHIDRIARKLNMDPIDLRMKNFLEPYAEDLLGGPELGNARIIECVEKGREAFDWDNRKTTTDGRYVTSVGMACATHGNGYFSAFQDYLTLYMRLDEDGQVFMNAGFHDQGCGTITTMKQIVGEVLQISMDKIFIPEVDTLVSPFDSAGTQASRVTYVCGRGAYEAAVCIKQQLLEAVKNVYGHEGCLVDGHVMIHGEKKTYKEVVIDIQNTLNMDISTSYKYQAKSNPAVYAVNFVETKIDTLTGLVQVTDVLAVQDIGQAINRGFVEGQVQGAIQMGIGYALTEEVKVDNKGHIKSDSFAKYHVVNMPDMPKVEVMMIEEPDDNGPFGAKSVGEISTCAMAPAVINAIESGLGIRIDSMPATPEKILKALGEKK